MDGIVGVFLYGQIIHATAFPHMPLGRIVHKDDIYIAETQTPNASPPFKTWEEAWEWALRDLNAYEDLEDYYE